jgi:hypothetical protein
MKKSAEKTARNGEFSHQVKLVRMAGHIWFGTLFERERERERLTSDHTITFMRARKIIKISRYLYIPLTIFYRGDLFVPYPLRT